jgi:NADH-quinone oxidoreductase subunit J
MFGLSAVAALLVVFITRATEGDPTRGYFYLFSSIALLASARVITHTRPVYSAIYFLLVIVSVAAMLVLLSAEFVAVALIIIYAGAILVTYLFVIMLAQQPGLPIHDRRAREPFAAVLAGFVLTAAMPAGPVICLSPRQRGRHSSRLRPSPPLTKGGLRGVLRRYR